MNMSLSTLLRLSKRSISFGFLHQTSLDNYHLSICAACSPISCSFFGRNTKKKYWKSFVVKQGSVTFLFLLAKRNLRKWRRNFPFCIVTAHIRPTLHLDNTQTLPPGRTAVDVHKTPLTHENNIHVPAGLDPAIPENKRLQNYDHRDRRIISQPWKFYGQPKANRKPK